MSLESSKSNLSINGHDLPPPGPSFLNDLTPGSRNSLEGSINLNDDLAHGSEYSSSIVSQPYGASSGGPSSFKRRSGSYISYKNSIDGGESTFLSSAYFNIFQNQNNGESSKQNNDFSPLGPNSIYELTIGSDTARSRRNRSSKTSLTLHGGSTVVNNIKTPTTKDIPQIQLLKLSKKVSNNELDSKLVNDSVDEYKNFELSYKLLTEDTLQKFVEQDRSHHNHEVTLSSGAASPTSSVSNLKDLIESNMDTDDKDISELIPDVYLDPEFRLDDPRIFKKVIEGCKILPDEDEEEGLNDLSYLASNTDLQDKLSHYLDLVEVKLIKEISKSSDSFFNTLGDIQAVLSQSESCIGKFREITKKLESLELNEAQTGLEILNTLNERKNIEQLETGIVQLQYVLSIFELAKKSFQNGLHNKCLSEIIVVENLINGANPKDLDTDENESFYPSFDYPLADLSSVPALRELKYELSELKNHCSKGYINDFIQLLLKDLRDHYSSVATQDTLNRIYVSVDNSKKYHTTKINTSYQKIDEQKKGKLRDFVENLSKAGHIGNAYSEYQNKIIIEIKEIIKLNLPSSRQGYSLTDMSEAPSRASPFPESASNSSTALSTNASGSNINSLSTNIRGLSPKEFETMMAKIYSTLAECLRRLTAHQKILLDLALTAIPPSASQDIDVMSLDITLAINKAIELTQIRLSKVINVRSEQIADLSVPFYLKMYSLSSAYLQECEFINPGYVASGPGSSLNDWVKNHVGYFIHRLHLNSMRNIALDCDRETWKEIVDSRILTENQVVLNELLDHSEYIDSNGKLGYSGENWLKPLDLFIEESKEESEQKPDNISNDNDESQKDKEQNGLKIHGEKFMIPSLAVKVLGRVRDYVIIAKVFPSKSHIIEVNLLNLFKLINSKSAQSVLNAGATRTAGLKHITTKHLALCIQFIEYNIEFLLNLQKIFKYSKSSPPPHPQQNAHIEEPTFNGIISNYRDHENELFSKLVSIMYDRTLIHCQNIVNIDWSQPLTHPQQCHTYMETLVKETSTVIKVLSKYLPELKCSMVMLQIFENYKKLLVDCFCTQLTQFKDFNEKHSLLKDIDYFRVKLCDLPGYGNSGQVIWENVNSLPTIEDAKMEEVMRNNIAGEKRSQIERVRNSASLELARDSKNLSKESLVETKAEPNEPPEVPFTKTDLTDN